jgi:hypothetical protein
MKSANFSTWPYRTVNIFLRTFFTQEYSTDKFTTTYRGLKNLVKSEVRAGYFEHVFLEHEVLSPKGFNVALQLGAEWAVVIKA